MTKAPSRKLGGETEWKNCCWSVASTRKMLRQGREGESRSVGRGIGIGSSRLPHASQPLRPLSPSSPCPSVPSRYTSC